MKRRHTLDFLKVMAMLIVILHHYQQVLQVTFPGGINFAFGKINFGLTVDFFFMISGFVMLKWVERIRKNAPGSDFKTFLFRRYRRFLPLLAVTAVCYELLCLLIRHFEPWLLSEYMTLSVWGTVCNILCIQSGWCMKDMLINNPTWYISVLMLCYIIFWLLTDLSRKKNISPVWGYLCMVMLGFSIQLSGMNLPFLNSMSARGYISFFLGLLLAMAEDKYELHTPGKTVFYLLFAALIIFAPGQEAESAAEYLLFPIVLLLFSSDTAEKIFPSRRWEILGEIQFHTYLWHLTVIDAMRVIMMVLRVNTEKKIYMFIAAAAAELVGTASYFLLAKPTDRLFMAVMPKEKTEKHEDKNSV